MNTPTTPPIGAVRSVETSRTLYGASVEYGLHCILWLAQPLGTWASSRDLADMQGGSAALVAKIFPKLEKAGLVESASGISGGYRLARSTDAITVLDVVDAIEGDRRLFDCREIRRGCAMFGGNPPAWSADGVCGIHAVMLRAENRMRAELRRTTLADIQGSVKAPPGFADEVKEWFEVRADKRERSRLTAVREGARRRTVSASPEELSSTSSNRAAQPCSPPNGTACPKA
ncbi:Rrf2 family transcriptional regulator [Methylobacterium sp. C25]|nr:Rrf2 family transcriptional regulator [Methylobacterium sp. C25]